MFGAVVFSPDGTLVAIETSEHLIVFDLTWNTELRRFPLKSTVLSRRMVFPHRGQKLFIEDGKTILECELDSNEQCKTLANDAFEGGAFAVSEEDRWLAYLDQNKIPEAIDLRNGGPKIRFSGLVSASDDLASFWSLATFSSDSKLLAVARGGRDALLFRMEPKPHFDSSRPISGGSYDMSFDRENRLFVCIMVQNGDNLASDSFKVLDVTDRKFVGGLIKGYAPQLVQHANAVTFKLSENPNVAQIDLGMLTLSTGKSSILAHLVANPASVHVSLDAMKVVYSEPSLSAVLLRDLASAAPPKILDWADKPVLRPRFHLRY